MLREIIIKQKEELGRMMAEPYIPREVVISDSGSDLVRVISGPRRAGKSFFAVHAMVKGRHAGYVNFDDERLLGIQNYDEITAAADAVYQNPEYLFFDEIQNLSRWELYVNRLQRSGRKIILTGSNANLLGSDLATHLTGRYLLTHIYPFSLREVLSVFPQALTEPERYQIYRDYIRKGGYPEIWLKQVPAEEYLNTLTDSVIFKDLIKRFRVRNISPLDALIRFMTGNPAREASLHTLAAVLDVSSPHTVKKYLSMLEEVFLVFSIPRFSFKLKEQISHNRKYYVFDNGIISSMGFSGSPDEGRLLENLVAISLKKREKDGSRVFFWRNQQKEEVDFVVFKNRKVEQLIQVCYDISHPATLNREIKALFSASRELNCDRLLLLTDHVEGKETVSRAGYTATICIQKAFRWFS